MENTSIGGSKYFLTLIDEYTRKVFIYFLKSKDQVASYFEQFQAQVENETGQRIKKLRMDNGREYVNQNLERTLRNSGIKYQLTVPYSPQLNGLAERMDRTLVEKARSMLFESDLPTCYWAEVSTAAYLVNRSPTKGLKNITPEEAWSEKKPDLTQLRVFCKALAYVFKEKCKKWDKKARDCVFVGYCTDSPSYRLMDPVTRTIFKNRDVVFYETTKDTNQT